MRVHEKVTVQMLSHIDFLRPVAESGHSDQMRFDADDPDHPIEPYIVMIADAYDAMTSTRSYRKALPQEVAFQELRDKAGIQFHPACVEALIHAIERRGEHHGAGFECDVEFENAPEEVSARPVWETYSRPTEETASSRPSPAPHARRGDQPRRVDRVDPPRALSCLNGHCRELMDSGHATT